MSSITERIAKFMERANHPNTPAAEADLCRERALFLIAKHNIDEAVLRAGSGTPAAAIIQWSDLWLTNTGGFVAERRGMLAAVAIALGAHTVIDVTREPGTKTVERHTVHVFATADLIDSLKLLLPSLMLQMESDNAKTVAAEKRRLTSEGLYAFWDRFGAKRRAAEERKHMVRVRRSHYIGWGNAVYTRLKAGIAQASAEVKGTGAELVLVDDTARAKAMGREQFPTSSIIKAKNHTGDQRAYALGTADGNRARLGQTDIGTRLAVPR